MMNRAMVGLVTMFFFLALAIPQASAWQSGFLYMQEIPIWVSTGTTNMDHQTRIVINNDNNGTDWNWTNECVDSNSTRARFYNESDDTSLDFWIEDCSITGQNLTAWVEVDQNITTAYNTTILLYYGDIGGTVESNMTNTFEFADDFNDGSVDWATRWQSSDEAKFTESGGKLVMAKPDASNDLINTQSSYANAIIEISIRNSDAGGSNYVDFPSGTGAFSGQDSSVLNFGVSKLSSTIGGVGGETGITPDISIYYRTVWEIPPSGDAELNISKRGVVEHTQADTPNTRTFYPSLFQWEQGTGYVDWIFVRKYHVVEPSYSIGEQQEDSGGGGENVSVTINDPQTATYYTDDLTLNFSASANTSAFSINASINGTSVYYNDSYTNATEIIVPLLGYLGYGTQTVTVFANTSGDDNSETVSPYIWHGLNITVFNANGSLATCYTLFATNGTTDIEWACQNDSTLIEWDDLPQGSINLTANATDFDNDAEAFVISNTMGFVEDSFTIYRIQHFYATSSGNPIGNFSMIELSTGNYWNNTADDNSTIEVSLRELSIGIQVYTFIVRGYGQINQTVTIMITSEENRTVEFTQSSLTINTYNERTFGALPFNLTITNGTAFYNTTGETNPYSDIWFNLPQGSITITVSSEGYVPREYYTVVSPYSVINLNAYLLSTTDGIFITFYVITYQGTPIENVILTAQKSIGAVLQTVEQETTDASGSATMYLDPYETYYIKVEAEDYISGTFNLNPDPINPVVYIRLELLGEAGADYVEYSTLFDAISFQFLPTEYYHNDSFTASYELSSSLSDIEYQGWNVTYSNGTSICSEIINDQPSGTTLTCVIPNTSGKYVLRPFFKRADYDEHTFNDYNYWVYHYAGIGGIVTSSAVSNMGYWLVAIVITLVMTGFASRFLGGYATGWLAIGIFAMFVTINPTIMVAEVSGWFIVGIMVVAMVSVMILRSYI